MIRSWPRPVRSASSADRMADSIIASIITSRASRGCGAPRVGVHELGQELLVERAPVDADADRLVVVDRHLDDRREVLVMALRADVARVDPVLRERPSHLRVLDQELVAVVMEVADDRDVDAEVADLADHLRDGCRGGVGVDRDPDELRSGVGELSHLDGRRVGIRGVGVGHRLDDDRMGRTDEHPADVDADGRTAARPRRVGRRHGPAPTRLATSKNVIQMRSENSMTKPTA